MKIEPSRFVDAHPLQLAGFDQYYTMDKMSEIPAQWNRFGPHIGNIPGQIGKVAYGLCHDMESGGFRYMSCVEVAGAADMPDGFTSVKLPAQKYAVFPHAGHVSELSKTVDAIWQAWLPESGQNIAEDPVMLERYGEAFDPTVGKGDVEIWIAIKS